MIILSIETSCDETAVSIVEAKGGLTEPHFCVLGNSLFSQIEIHKEFGGVFPTIAKREHAKNFPLLLVKTMTEARKYERGDENYDETIWEKIKKITEREEGLFESLKKHLEKIKKPNVDVIAVTAGPGLEPALWVGISCAKALGTLWDIPVIPINHMEGHITSVLFDCVESKISNLKLKNNIQFPAVALLVSGGHTELIKISDWSKYTLIGQTRDDAVGEAFDKVARMLGLPYPGGPEISNLAEKARSENLPRKAKLPRPMIHSNDSDFSFSGIKTAVLYYIRDLKELTPEDKMDIAREFEDAVIEVLLAKTKQAILDTGSDCLIIAGGVVANKRLREEFYKLKEEFTNLIIKTPSLKLSTDNALMISASAYIQIEINPKIISEKNEIKASGNLKLSSTKNVENFFEK